MTIDLLEPERAEATRDVVWRRQFIARNRMETHRNDREKVLLMFDQIPFHLRAEYYKRRRARLKKYFEDE
jgi:hypothetical protein